VVGIIVIYQGESMKSIPAPLQKNPDRPAIPAGYGIRTDSEGLLTWEWVDDRMQKSRNYWICSTRPDGRPHAIPVWGVWFEDTLFFGTDPVSTKGKNLAADPRVVVHLESGDEVVIIESNVQEVKDKETLTAIAQAYNRKYPGFSADPDVDLGGITYAVRPQSVLAWLENDFINSATRWRIVGPGDQE
jgi:hypothetical protein